MSNGLYAKDRIDIALQVEGTDPFDRAQIILRADVLRGETFARMIGVLGRSAPVLAAGGWSRRRTHRARRDAGSGPWFVVRETGAARDIGNRTGHERGSVNPASKALV